MDTNHTDTCKCVPFNKDILDASDCKLHHVSTNHTDSVEAVTQEAVFIHQAFQRAKPHDYHTPFEETNQEYQRVMKSIASELIARNQQQVEEAVRKERERIWHEVSLKTPSLSANWPKGATYNSGKIEGWNVCKSFIKSVLNPNHQEPTHYRWNDKVQELAERVGNDIRSQESNHQD